MSETEASYEEIAVHRDAMVAALATEIGDEEAGDVVDTLLRRIKRLQSSPQFDEDGNFIGHQPRACGEHRTVGEHRAWCHDCTDWCYPEDGCIRCRHPEG